MVTIIFFQQLKLHFSLSFSELLEAMCYESNMFRIQVPDSIDDKRPIYHMLHLNSISENLRTRYIERPPMSSPQLSPVNVDHGSPYLLRKAR